jgi:hypothetical protein
MDGKNPHYDKADEKYKSEFQKKLEQRMLEQHQIRNT